MMTNPAQTPGQGGGGLAPGAAPAVSPLTTTSFSSPRPANPLASSPSAAPATAPATASLNPSAASPTNQANPPAAAQAAPISVGQVPPDTSFIKLSLWGWVKQQYRDHVDSIPYFRDKNVLKEEMQQGNTPARAFNIAVGKKVLVAAAITSVGLGGGGLLVGVGAGILAGAAFSGTGIAWLVGGVGALGFGYIGTAVGVRISDLVSRKLRHVLNEKEPNYAAQSAWYKLWDDPMLQVGNDDKQKQKQGSTHLDPQLLQPQGQGLQNQGGQRMELFYNQAGGHMDDPAKCGSFLPPLAMDKKTPGGCD